MIQNFLRYIKKFPKLRLKCEPPQTKKIKLIETEGAHFYRKFILISP